MIDNLVNFFPHRISPKIYIDDCINVLNNQENVFDSIITDPPYEISLMGMKLDDQGISFSPVLWDTLFRVVKPGGFVAAFGATRLFHKLVSAAELSGFTIYPFMTWQFSNGLPKPANVSELFDRDNIPNREIIGYKNGSGFTKANVDHGAQNRTSTKFPIYARGVSEESKKWSGYYYGVNTLKPSLEPILIAQKPISEKRVIDNIRHWGTGALNVGALQERNGSWPTNTLHHSKTSKADHGSKHPSVKPVSLMEDLCLLACPANGHILDPFAGTGTTGIAARGQGFSSTLIEQNPDMEEVIKRRLS